MPKKIEIAPIDGHDYPRGSEREKPRPLDQIRDVLLANRYEFGTGLQIEQIYKEADLAITLESLKNYLPTWERERALDYTDGFGIKWDLVVHRSTYTYLERKSIVSLGQSVRAVSRGKTLETPFADVKAGKDTSVLTQLLQKGGHWNYFGFLEEIQSAFPAQADSSISLEDRVRAFFTQHFTTLDIEPYFDNPTQQVAIRISLLVSAINVHSILTNHGIAESTNPHDRILRLDLDPLWISYMTAINELVAKLKESKIDPFVFYYLIITQTLWEKKKIVVNQKDSLVQTSKSELT